MPSVHDLSIRQLEYLVAVGDTLGFHRASERCGVSQPTLSAQVREAEEVLGVTLFERDTRRVLVTPSGALVIERARRVLRELEDLLETAARTKDPFAGSFRFGVIPTVAPYLLPDVSLAWSKAYPKLQISWREEQTDPLLTKVERGDIDAALLSLLPGMNGLSVEPVLDDPFLVALPKGHPLAKRASVRLTDLEGLTVLLLDDGHCLRTETLALCSRAGVREAGFRATSLSTLAQMVSSGAGVTLLPRLAASVENRRGQLELRPFAEKKPPSRTIVMAFRPTSPFGETFRTLAKALRAALGGA